MLSTVFVAGLAGRYKQIIIISHCFLAKGGKAEENKPVFFTIAHNELFCLGKAFK
jgi:hypothetical protein